MVKKGVSILAWHSKRCGKFTMTWIKVALKDLKMLVDTL